jgi:hypothetical protein
VWYHKKNTVSNDNDGSDDNLGSVFRRFVGGGQARHSEELTSIGQATHFVFNDVASAGDDRRRLLVEPVCIICNISVGCCVKVYARTLFTLPPICKSLKKLIRGIVSCYCVVSIFSGKQSHPTDVAADASHSHSN